MRALLIGALVVSAGACAAVPEPGGGALPLVQDCSADDVRPDGQRWAGAATAVIDGDSFCMGAVEVRLRRLNAPEFDAPGGPEARAALRALLSASPDLACESFARSYDRVIARCVLPDGRDIEAALSPIVSGG